MSSRQDQEKLDKRNKHPPANANRWTWWTTAEKNIFLKKTDEKKTLKLNSDVNISGYCEVSSEKPISILVLLMYEIDT